MRKSMHWLAARRSKLSRNNKLSAKSDVKRIEILQSVILRFAHAASIIRVNIQEADPI